MSGAEKLMTPIFLKTADGMELPINEPAYLLVSGNGLWMCRNHEFFQSSTPARSWPCELANHSASLTLNHPKIPQEMLEEIVGFFAEVAARHCAEAGVILVWDQKQQRMDVIVPRQFATVNETWSGKVYPIGLHYELPTDLDKDVFIIADVHSHVYDAAYSSYQDRSDEEYRAGLHLVVGRLDCEPPQFHAEFVVDGIRFDVDLGTVMEGYQCRCKQVPQDWLKLVSIKTLGPGYSTSSGYNDFSKSPLPSPGHYRDDTKSSRWPDESENVD